MKAITGDIAVAIANSNICVKFVAIIYGRNQHSLTYQVGIPVRAPHDGVCVEDWLLLW